MESNQIEELIKAIEEFKKHFPRPKPRPQPTTGTWQEIMDRRLVK